MLRLIIFATFMISILGACQFSSLASNFFNTPAGAVLFQDDFSNVSSGWENFNDEQIGTMDYFDGFYRIRVQGDHNLLWAGPGLSFSDIRLETNMIKVIGTSDDIFGLVCRASDHENFYFFVISSDGYYGIGKMVAGIQSLIDAEGMHPSEVISQGKSINHLRADCIADRLEFFINGQLVAGVNDTDLTSGEVGLLAGNLGSSENAVLFDNFSAIKP
jgi:hypothetical protein